MMSQMQKKLRVSEYEHHDIAHFAFILLLIDADSVREKLLSSAPFPTWQKLLMIIVVVQDN